MFAEVMHGTVTGRPRFQSNRVSRIAAHWPRAAAQPLARIAAVVIAAAASSLIWQRAMPYSLDVRSRVT